MPNLSGGVWCVCPYYLRETPKSISCEGFAGDACLVRFACTRDKVEWAAAHCERMDYAVRCPYARMMEAKYRDVEQ